MRRFVLPRITHDQACDNNVEQLSYQGYSYAYPHKTAYRPLPATVNLRDLWANEDRDSLSLSPRPVLRDALRLRNLFTQANPRKVANNCLNALERRKHAGRELSAMRIRPHWIGGGTPTFP